METPVKLRRWNRRVISSNGGWEKTWKAGATPWDLLDQLRSVNISLRRVHCLKAELLFLVVERMFLDKDTAFLNILCCVLASNETLQVYDVVAVACPDRHVVGLSKTVIEKSSKVSTVHLCPMQTSVRPPWAQRIEKLLKPSGELITLMFPMDERSGGPPYKVSVSDYEKVLIPLGFEAMSIVDKERAITPRKAFKKIKDSETGDQETE
ncbi:probable thiol methyltransferase 2 isoform X2 [Brassica napus]|uniref:probable thiol methyltransferase 2 isoform X2 n=1 Tax=Brassica napus TaxID=3708 RepID=UPI00207AC5C5|nr:probable thiol methyltransferase 2 isoform X2 [Brassica napus]